MTQQTVTIGEAPDYITDPRLPNVEIIAVPTPGPTGNTGPPGDSDAVVASYVPNNATATGAAIAAKIAAATTDMETTTGAAAKVATESGDRIAADASLQSQIDAVEASDVDSVAGLTGTVTAPALQAALSLPTDTVTELSGKADQTDLATEISDRTTADSAEVAARNAAIVADRPNSTPAWPAITAKPSFATVATTGSANDITTGTLSSSVLPAIAITDVFPVASQAAMLALTAEKGDVAIRTDLNTAFMLATNSPGTLADWKSVTPSGSVTSVNGQQGVITLAKGDVGLGSVDDTADSAKPVSSAQQIALDLKAPLASPAFTGTPTGITKAHVGLGNVDNTSDISKPISTLAQAALNAKADVGLVWVPADNGLISASSPIRAILSGFTPPAGYQYLHRLWVPGGAPITNAHVYLEIAGATVAGGSVTIYEADGTRSGDTAAITTGWQSVGMKTHPLVVPVASQVAGRYVWMALYFASAATAPGFGYTATNTVSAATNFNTSPKSQGYIYGAPASSVTLASITDYVELWNGLS